MNLRTINLKAFNSLTKYPSILTYHVLDPKNGRLTEARNVTFEGTVIATEKVDGTNSRVVVLRDGSYLLGSREELLYARGDLLHNPALSIVDALRPTADRLADAVVQQWPSATADVTVFYFETFGGNVTAASKHYTSTKAVSVRLFDVALFGDVATKLDGSPEHIAAFREGGGQTWFTEDDLARAAATLALALTPRVAVLPSAEMPLSIDDGDAFLKRLIPATRCALDPAASGEPEGLVVRSRDRAQIAKIRLEDYRRTLRKGR